MRTIRFSALIFSVISFLQPDAYAADLRVQPAEVKDTRSGEKFGSSLDITFNLFGDDLERGQAVRCDILKAVDETGRDLIQTDKGMMFGPSRNADFRFSREELTDREKLFVQLKNPSRKATVIREISGEIEIFKPKLDPQCVVIFSDISGKSSKPLANPLLDASQIEITILPAASGGQLTVAAEPCGPCSGSKNSLAPAPMPSGEAAPLPPAGNAEQPSRNPDKPQTAAKDSSKAAREEIPGTPSDSAKVEATDANAAKVTKPDSDAGDQSDADDETDAEKKLGPAVGQAMGNALGQAFSRMFGGAGQDDNSVQMTIKDPSNKLVAIEFIDSAGNVLANNGSSSSGENHCYYFSQPLPKNAKIRVFVATDKSVIKVPFALKDVALP